MVAGVRCTTLAVGVQHPLPAVEALHRLALHRPAVGATLPGVDETLGTQEVKLTKIKVQIALQQRLQWLNRDKPSKKKGRKGNETQ